MGPFYQALLQRLQDLKSAQEQQLREQRLADDHYVTGGTNWNSYSLESLIKMVAHSANPAQLQFLADTWRTHGEKLTESAENLRRSLLTLMQYWSGEGADEATRTVARNSRWIAGIGETATEIAEPVDDSGGALTSAQSTMPGAPKGGFWAGLGTAGGAAAAGFAVGGPFGAAAGAVLGGIASAFGFGSNKKKLKRKAVQTMVRYETAILGIDRATPRFNQPVDGIIDPIWNRPGNGDGVGTMPPGHRPPGGPGAGVPGDGSAVGGPGFHGGPGFGTTPSFADSPSSRWGALTGAGPYGAGAGSLGGFAGGIGDDAARNGRMFGAGVPGAGMGGMPMAGRPGGGAIERGANKYGRLGAGMGGAGGYGPGGMGAGSARKEDDQEHRRRFPVEEDLFADGLKAAPPVIGL
ncbi:MAG: hypothetical protein ABW215_11115 [Kibdelosporangium sp.]